VASNVGGIPELVDPGATGVLVPPEDAPALAQALVEVLSDRVQQERMGVEGRKRAVARDPQGEFAAGIARLADHLRAASSGLAPSR
jgi:glycosyltransferase involved in cell wall biosynthesis